MPKKLENVESTLLENGRRMLFENGYRDLTIRAVAKESGVAPGTVYNYFENKEYFLARIIIRDWMKIREKSEKEFADLTGKEEKAKMLFGMVRELISMYDAIWNEYSEMNYGLGVPKKYHDWFIKSLIEDFEFPWFIIEVIVHFAMLNTHSYSDIEEYIRKLL